METILTMLLVLFIVAVLYLLSDTITEFLSNGKSFAPNETTWK